MYYEKFLEINPVDLTVVLTVGIIVALEQYFILDKIRVPEILEYMIGTFIAMVYVLLLLKVIPYVKATSENQNEIVFGFTSLGVIATLLAMEYMVYINCLSSEVEFISIIAVSFIAGLVHLRYSLWFNLAFVIILFYFGTLGVEYLLRDLGYGLAITTFSQLIRFSIFVKWVKEPA